MPMLTNPAQVPLIWIRWNAIFTWLPGKKISHSFPTGHSLMAHFFFSFAAGSAHFCQPQSQVLGPPPWSKQISAHSDLSLLDLPPGFQTPTADLRLTVLLGAQHASQIQHILNGRFHALPNLLLTQVFQFRKGHHLPVNIHTSYLRIIISSHMRPLPPMPLNKHLQLGVDLTLSSSPGLHPMQAPSALVATCQLACLHSCPSNTHPRISLHTQINWFLYSKYPNCGPSPENRIHAF